MNIANPRDIKIIHGLPPVAKKGDKISIDTEFFGMEKRRLHRPHGTFAYLGCSYDGKIVYYTEDESQIAEFLQRLELGVWIFANAKFDIRQLRRYANIPDRKNLWDVILIEQIQYSGYYNEFALNDLVRRYLDTYLPKDVREEFSDTVSPDSMSSPEEYLEYQRSRYVSQKQVEYASLDVAYTWQVFQEQREKICDDDLRIWREIELPFMWTILSMSGIRLDTEKWSALAIENGRIAQEIQDKYGHWVTVPAEGRKKEKQVFEGVNLNSPAQVKKHFAECGWDLKSSDAEALEKVLASGDGHDAGVVFAGELLTYRTYAKRASTYGLKFIEDHVEADGKIYADIYQIGAECMPAGELVLTNRGYIPVEDVDVGDLVITHEGRSRPIVNTSVHTRSQIYRVTLFNGLTLRTTGNHPYLTKDRGWVAAKNLHYGEVVVYHSRPEVWKRIQDWSDYSVSTWGRVQNNKTGNILALQPKGKWGHLKVTLVRNGSRVRGEDRKDFMVHRLVAETFIYGKDKIHSEVRHLNGFAWDNTVENLCWGTSLENRQDAVQHGTMSHRYTSSQTKLTDEMVAMIRQPDEYYRGRDKVLADEFGISREMVRDVRLGKRWQDGYFDGKEKKVEFKYTLVTDVTIVSNQVTYGLEVEEDHSHVTGGIVTHNTGRTSCRAPNLQNQPHETAYRECFICDEDEVVIVADWSAQEPKFAAFLSEDAGLMDALNSEEKLYVRVARDILNISITKSDPEYKHMKSTVLGIFYGMSAVGLAATIGVTEEVAQDYINAFLETYPGVKEYMRKQKRAKDYVTSVNNRKIWLNKYSYQWERNALNAPIQGSAADAMKIAASKFTKFVYDSDCGWKLALLVHDEIVIITPKSDRDAAMKVLEDCMVSTANELHPGIKGSVEIFSGCSWACKS